MKDQELTIEIKEQSGFTVVAPMGEIKRIEESNSLQEKIFELINKGMMSLAVDLTNCTYLDSSAVNVLVSGFHGMNKKSGKFIIVQSQHEDVNSILELVGVDKIIQMVASVQELS